MDGLLHAGLFFGLPLIAVASLIAGIVLKGKCPTWLLGVACLSPLGYALWLLSSSFVAGVMDRGTSVGIYMALAFGLLVWAMLAGRGGWRFRRLMTLLGLAMPVPVSAYVFYMIVWGLRVMSEMG